MMKIDNTISINVNARFDCIAKVMRYPAIHKTESHIRQSAHDRN
jgi:hypothetical protein